MVGAALPDPDPDGTDASFGGVDGAGSGAGASAGGFAAGVSAGVFGVFVGGEAGVVWVPPVLPFFPVLPLLLVLPSVNVTFGGADA